ncbi:hypothetical protein [Lachnobacterium bovis]|uniref:hypothetical protein n=1 Tax=Lachnobacterium bovis TaxID=140626 RepID=UPI00069021E8|nr:hypothetical protein [Lachnobacterium bovis]
MNTKFIPAIVMLIGGLIDCIFAIINHLNLFDFTLELLIVLIVFLVIGECVRYVLEQNLSDFADENGEESDEETDDEEYGEADDIEEEADDLDTSEEDEEY